MQGLEVEGRAVSLHMPCRILACPCAHMPLIGQHKPHSAAKSRRSMGSSRRSLPKIKQGREHIGHIEGQGLCRSSTPSRPWQPLFVSDRSWLTPDISPVPRSRVQSGLPDFPTSRLPDFPTSDGSVLCVAPQLRQTVRARLRRRLRLRLRRRCRCRCRWRRLWRRDELLTADPGLCAKLEWKAVQKSKRGKEQTVNDEHSPDPSLGLPRLTGRAQAHHGLSRASGEIRMAPELLTAYRLSNRLTV